MDQERELLEISGSVESLVYKNEENGYTVLRLLDENGERITVVGSFPHAAPGETMILSGQWTTHSVHGSQFKAEFSQRLMPSDAPAIYRYLAGGAVKGIGPATASLIVERFGDKALEVLEREPGKLTAIRGISLAKAEQMSKSFRQQAGVRRLTEFISSFGLRPLLALRLYKAYGDDALEIVRANPYVMVTDLIGGSFAEADRMAMEMGMDGNSMDRIKAAVLFELRHNMGNGHCFIPREKLAEATAELIRVETDKAEEGIRELRDLGALVQEDVAGVHACYLPELYEAETDTAMRLARMAQGRYAQRADTEAIIQKLESVSGMRYAQRQRDTLRLALENQLLVITGGPGTGKTTSIRAIMAMFDHLGLKTLLAAPTGRAAKRMSELSGREALTIHRLLGAKFAEDGEHVIFTKDEGDPLDCDAVILDECSMVDILMMDALLRALPPMARLVLVGDQDQLPSVGPGRMFAAVIDSGVAPTVRLTEIFRQNDDSRIVRNAHMINRGEAPDLSENVGDFFRMQRPDKLKGVETILELCTLRLPQRMKIPAGEIQVLSPTRKGELGTVNLNKCLQQALNPPAENKKEKPFGEVIFRVGDRVMQVRNNYDLLWRSLDNTASGMGVYNGDIGRVAAIDLDAENLTVDFDGRLASYPFESLTELEHAWAMTVHKAQGSEFRAVILALSASAPVLLTRDLLYTAITRARELLILVGDERNAYRMIENSRQSKRYAALRTRLRALSEQ